MHDFCVLFGNNQGERDLQMMKMNPKGLGLFKTMGITYIFYSIRGYILHLEKMGIVSLMRFKMFSMEKHLFHHLKYVSNCQRLSQV